MLLVSHKIQLNGYLCGSSMEIGDEGAELSLIFLSPMGFVSFNTMKKVIFR